MHTRCILYPTNLAMHPFLDNWKSGDVAAFSHRGDSTDHPENTMAAFESAIELGYSFLETDVRTTRDGVLVAFHDDNLERITGRPGLISRTDWSDLRKVRIAGSEPVPLLADILAAWPEARVNIDPKNDRSASKLLAVLGEFNAWDRVCVGSFSGRRLAYLRRQSGPKLCTSMGPAEVVRLRAASFGWPAGPWQANCVQVPPRYYGLTVVDRRFVATAHRFHLPVHVWTINSVAMMNDLLDLGIDGIMTDKAAALKGLLIERDLWSQASIPLREHLDPPCRSN